MDLPIASFSSRRLAVCVSQSNFPFPKCGQPWISQDPVPDSWEYKYEKSDTNHLDNYSIAHYVTVTGTVQNW